MSRLTLFKSVPQLRPTGDAEFGEDAIQVPTNGAVREKEALADLTVRPPFGGELRDLGYSSGRSSSPSNRFEDGPARVPHCSSVLLGAFGSSKTGGFVCRLPHAASEFSLVRLQIGLHGCSGSGAEC